MSARGVLTGAGPGSVWPRGPWRGFQVQKDTLFCRFEANPGSWTAALTRPVVGVTEEIQGVLSMDVGGWADLLLRSTQPHLVDRGPPGHSKRSLSLDLHQGLPDPAVPRDCRCQQVTCDCSVWCDLPNSQCPTRQQMSWPEGLPHRLTLLPGSRQGAPRSPSKAALSQRVCCAPATAPTATLLPPLGCPALSPAPQP